MSQKLGLDFVNNQAFSLSRLTPISMLIILTSLVIASYIAIIYRAKIDEYNNMQSQLEQIQPVKKHIVNHSLNKTPVAELKQISDVAADISTPWRQLLEGLEEVEMRDIALLSLEPNKKKQQLVLGGQAKNMQAALNYIEALEKLPMLSQVFLQKHTIDQLDPFKPVAFTIVAKWS